MSPQGFAGHLFACCLYEGHVIFPVDGFYHFVGGDSYSFWKSRNHVAAFYFHKLFFWQARRTANGNFYFFRGTVANCQAVALSYKVYY